MAILSSIVMIAEDAGMPISPAASAAATNGCRAGASSPENMRRGAVASPTDTSFAASPTVVPVVAAISVTGVR